MKRPVRPASQPAHRGRCRPAHGFTLVEVLVALGIVAIALLAGIQATSALTRNAERQTDVLLAQICAENEQVRLRLTRQMPGLGITVVECQQAGQLYSSEVNVQATPNPNFRRVDVRVLREEQPVLQLSSVLGMY
jgi:general secretion pathway protein I